MKKIVLVTTILLFITISIFPKTTHAKTCTNYQPQPYFYQVAPDVTTPVYHLQTASNVCQGTNTEVWFRAFRTFPESYGYLDAKFDVWLYEDDPADSEPDELVKKYIFRVINRVITEAYLLDTPTPGNIDSTGDQTCELYLQIGGLTGQCCYIPMEKTVFDYNICMN